jgi:hypothetical protein
MAEKALTSEEFEFSATWPSAVTAGGDCVLDASVGRLKIAIEETILTAFSSDKGDSGSEITMPLYDVAEWIASNWWSLLFEPRKSEPNEQAGDDFGFRSRHWLGFARNGFALPDVWFLPAGDFIEISATADTYLPSARVTFLEGAAASVPLMNVREALSNFVNGVTQKLDDAGIRGTQLHECWKQVLNTSSDEEMYCRLVGSLGVSPYEEHETIDSILFRFAKKMDAEDIVSDMCQASDDTSLSTVADVVEKAYDALPQSAEINIHQLLGIRLPTDHSAQAWRWGKEAAAQVRREFSIPEASPDGGTRFLDALNLESGPATLASATANSSARVSGLLSRHDEVMQIAIVDQTIPQRRFSASRAAFIGWAARRDGSRLVTGARTREQQASRAFAAEILAPIKYIRRRTSGARAISGYRIAELAEELNVSPAVVKYQAQNDKINILDSSNFM